MKQRFWNAMLIAGLLAIAAVALGALAQRAKPPVPPASGRTVSSTSAVKDDPSARRSENYQIVDDSTEGIALPPDEIVQQDAPVIVTNALVTRVKDGDTIVARPDNGEEVTVRLLGVNTPETVDPRKPVECFGKEASKFTKSKLDGQRVRLLADPQADERDKYGRLLRNVILEDGTDYNALLIKDGYAYAYLSFPLDPARKRELKQLETEAREAKRGLWADGACEE